MVALPLLGLLALIQAASLRSPLSETEAPLAIAARYPTRRLVATATPHTSAERMYAAKLNEDVPDGTSWSFLSGGPYASLINLNENVRTDWVHFRQYGFALPSTAMCRSCSQGWRGLGGTVTAGPPQGASRGRGSTDDRIAPGT